MPDDHVPAPAGRVLDEPVEPVEALDPALARRLDSYFDELAADPMPDSLVVAPSSIAARPRPVAPRAWVGAGAAAAVVVLLLVVLGRGPNGQVVVGSGGSTTVTSNGPAPIPVPGDGNGVDDQGEDGGSAGEGTPVGTDPLGDPAAPDGSAGAPGGSTLAAGVTMAPRPEHPGSGATTTTPGGVTTTLPMATSTTTTPSTTASTTASTSSTTTTPPSDLLFLDEFTANPAGSAPAGWSLDVGTWRVSVTGGDHWLDHTSGPGAEGKASAGQPGWGDVMATADVRFGAGELVGVGVRYQDASNYVFCKFDRVAERLYLGTLVGGQVNLLDQEWAPAASGSSHRLVLTAVGSSLDCRVEGGAVTTAQSSQFTAGRVAVFGKGDVGITRVEVRAR